MSVLRVSLVTLSLSFLILGCTWPWEDDPSDPGGLADALTVEDDIATVPDLAGQDLPTVDPNKCTELPCDIIQRTNPKAYRIDMHVHVTNAGEPLNRLDLIFPVPATSTYQDISNASFSDGGQLLDFPNTEDQYVRYMVKGDDLPAPGESKTWTYSFDATFWEVTANLDRVGELPDYDVESDLYKWYTGTSWAYCSSLDKECAVIDPQGVIEDYSVDMMAEATDRLDYIRMAYDFTLDYVTYEWNPDGPNPSCTADVLNGKKGYCASFQQLFVALVRSRSIPARPLLSPGLEGTAHVWSEFYLEGYGWIPADPAFGDGDPNTDYLGYVPNDAAHFPVVSREMDLEIDFFDWNFTQAGVQTPFPVAYPVTTAIIDWSHEVVATPTQAD
jgi:hypothetical protein